jgi:ATP-dependent protease ClpP protease subunit
LSSKEKNIYQDIYTELNSYDPNTGVVCIYDEITPRTVKSISEFVSAFIQDPVGNVAANSNVITKSIWIELMSQGGCAKSALAIYDILVGNIPDFIDIHTVGIGYVCSAASIIYCAGNIRLAYPNTEFIFHKPTVGQIEGTKDRLMLKREYIDRVEAQMLSVYANCIGIERTKALKVKIDDGEVLLNTMEAKKMGFVTDILEGEEPKKVSKKEQEKHTKAPVKKPVEKAPVKPTEPAKAPAKKKV